MATLSTSFAASFAGLLCLRLLLGVGESVTYPASSRILATVIPENRRGLANSLVDLGARIGPALGTTCGAMLVMKLGWRGLFLITGTAGTIWLVPWFIWAPRVEFAVAGLCLSGLVFGVYASNLFSLTQTLAGPAAAGRWTGLQNACGNLAGLVSPVLTGWIVTRTGEFAFAFVAAGIACLAGAASFGLLVREP